MVGGWRGTVHVNFKWVTSVVNAQGTLEAYIQMLTESDNSFVLFNDIWTP